MKLKLFIVLLILINYAGFCQVAKVISGTVSSENFPLKDIEVINQTSQKMTVTDALGNFSISIKEKDILIIFSTEYNYQEITITPAILSKSVFKVEMIKKPIQIDEVIVEKESHWSSDYMQQILDKRYTSDGQSAIKNTMIYDGSITDGVNFIAVGKKLGKLFKKKDIGKEVTPDLEFSDFITANFNEKFFLETLKLKPEEVLLFLEFCKADPKSETISQGNNTLKAMDFLLLKNDEFKKTNRILNTQKP